MLVASGLECDDACLADSGRISQVIGHIQTAIGRGTITRPSGIAAQVTAGDPVCQGDVIETAADGRIEIRFIDGTSFNLAGDTRVELNAFARDANGVLPLLAVTRGTFAFTAGQLAGRGALTVDTPVGSIRSRAHASGIGILSLAALTFSFLKQAQAADPNVTFLDDDSITYKDFHHGSFELITKEAVPRHILVEDPGETVVLNKVGSSVGVNQVANSPARMEELQIAQQDALANYAKGFGPNGSSTPPLLNGGGLLQPINFIQPDATNGQHQLPQLQMPVILELPLDFNPPPTLAITSIGGQIAIAGNDIINAAKADAGVEIAGGTSGVENGRIVTITIVDGSGHVVFSSQATVSNSGWLINVSPTAAKAMADGIYTVTADVTNAAGIPAQASQAVRVDETPPTIAIGPVVGNDIINVKTAGSGFAVTGTSTDAENGQPVTVRIVDSLGHVVETFATTLANNTWSIRVSAAEAKLLHDGAYTVTADVSDTAGNPAPQATHTITVDETAPAVTWLPQAESGVEGTAIALGTITATVSNVPGFSNGVQSLVVSGIPAGAMLTDGTNSFTATSGNTSVDVKSWNLTDLKITPPNDTNFQLTVTATDQAANTTSASEMVTVAPVTPGLNPAAAQGNEDTAIALDLGVVAKSLVGVNGDAIANSLATVVVSGIPAGATLSDGTGLPGHSFTATANNTSHDIASWNLSSLKITPPAEFEGSFTLTIAAAEHDTEGDVSATVTASEIVMVLPVAAPPAANAPATLTLDENAAGVAILGVSVGPPAEDLNDTVSATLTVSHGTLHVASLTGVTVTGDDSATLTLSGSAAAVNGLLAGLTYTPTTEYEGADTLHLAVTSSDGANTNPTTATASTTIAVNPVAEPPTASAPATLTLDENAAGVALLGVSVGPPAEDPNDTLSATLTVSHGTLHVASLTGVTVTGDDSGTLTLSGSAAAVNGLLAGLTYTPTAEYEGPDALQLSVTSSDGANTNPATATASTTITVNPIAEPPAAAAPTTLALDENAVGVAVDGVSIGPAAEDPNDTVSATLTVSHGTLHVASLTGVTVSGDDSATLTLSGSAADVNSLLAALTYTPTTEYEGSDTLHVAVTSSDGANTNPTTATASTAITVNPVAEPPTATAPATLTVRVDDDDDDEDDITVVAIAGVRVGPLAEDGDDRVSATLTVAHGTLHVGSVSGVTVTGDGGATLTLSGSAAAVNSLLAGLTYTPTTDYEGSDTLHLSVTSLDGGNASPTQATAVTAITIAPDAESLIVGGPGPMLSWNDPANWSDHFVPTFGIEVTIDAPSNYTALIAGTPIAHAASLTIPHGAATTEIAVGGTLQLAGNLDISDAGKLENDGTLEELANAGFTGPITNNGTIIVDPNVNLNVTGTITGTGQFWIDSGTTLEFALGSKVAPGATDSQIIFFEQGSGKLIIDDWGKFAGVITGTNLSTHVTTTDLIDLTQLPFVGGSMSAAVSYDSGAKISTVVFSDGNSANNVTLHFSGDYTGATWTFTSINGGAGTEIDDPPSPTVTGSPTRSIGSNAASPTATAGVLTAAPNTSSGANVVNDGDTMTDVVIGAFAGALLTGGGGSYALANSPAARSGASQLDSGKDFVPGSDKIDLTAFGSLSHTLVPLSPANSSVPAHTIAYDSKASQTVVYVNPGDHPLSVGDSGLVEIHLPVATVQLSDFVLAAAKVAAPAALAGDPMDLAATTHNDAAATVTATAVDSTNTATVTATADVSIDATVGNSAHAADGSSAAPAISVGDGSDTSRDHAAAVDSIKVASLDEGAARSADDSANAVATPGSGGPSIETPTVTVPVQTSFTSNEKPVSDGPAAVTFDHGAAIQGLNNGDHEASTPKSAGPTDASDAHTHEIDIGWKVAPGSADAQGYTFHFNDEISGFKNSGLSAATDNPGSMGHHEDAAAPHGSLALSAEAETLGTLGEAFHFKDAPSSFKDAASNPPAALDQILASTNHHDEGIGSHTALAISDGAFAFALPPPEQNPNDHFNGIGHHGALVTHVPHDLIV